MRHQRWFILCLLTAFAAAAPAAAQTWPSRPITMVVPFPPGPALDLVARLVGIKLAEALGQSVVTENRTGANGMIGSNLVARAPPDGNTLLMTTASTHVTAVHLMKNLSYDPIRDFVSRQLEHVREVVMPRLGHALESRTRFSFGQTGLVSALWPSPRGAYRGGRRSASSIGIGGCRRNRSVRNARSLVSSK